jgi:hypothetical protein
MLAVLMAALGVTLPLAASSCARTQTHSGGITGTVTDSSGEKLTDATVTAFSPDGRMQATTAVSGAGVFVLSGLPAGPYGIEVYAAGFAPSPRTNVEVPSGQDARRDFKMEKISATRTDTNLPDPPRAAYPGKVISMDLRTDIKDILRRLADIGGLDVDFNPSVNSTITIRAAFKDVPWDEALGTVLSNSWLTSELQGKTLRITTNPLPFPNLHPIRIVTIRGKIAGFQFQNPMTFLQVEAPAAQGLPHVWLVRWASADQLTGEGVTGNRFKPGDRVVINGYFEGTDPAEMTHLMRIRRRVNGPEFTWGARWVGDATRSDSDTDLVVISEFK